MTVPQVCSSASPSPCFNFSLLDPRPRLGIKVWLITGRLDVPAQREAGDAQGGRGDRLRHPLQRALQLRGAEGLRRLPAAEAAHPTVNVTEDPARWHSHVSCRRGITPGTIADRCFWGVPCIVNVVQCSVQSSACLGS